MRIRTAIAAGALGAVTLLGAAAGTAVADDDPVIGGSANSPGVLSGNTTQIPVKIPVNACGNSLNVLALLGGAGGNVCANR